MQMGVALKEGLLKPNFKITHFWSPRQPNCIPIYQELTAKFANSLPASGVALRNLQMTKK